MKMDYDIIVIGAGPAGLSFARAMADTGLNIALLERQALDKIQKPAYDGREIALTHLSHDLMQKYNIWEHMPSERISLIEKAKVLNGHSHYSLDFDHEETGKPNLGFMVSNHLIRQASYDAVKDYKNIHILCEKDVKNVGTDDTHGWITFADDTKLTAPMLIAADSRFSQSRQKMGISTDMLDFGRLCVVCKMKITGDHEKTAFECFYYDRTLAVLPLNDQEVSVVITLDAKNGAEVMNISHEDFAEEIMTRTEGRFGDMELSTELYPYPLVATYAKQFYTNRFALIGDAAVGMHPVTAHGYNLGLRSAHLLATELQKQIMAGGDIAGTQALRRYNRKHRNASRPIYLGTNTLVKIYTQNSRPARFARKALLHLGNRLKPAKKLIMNQLTEIDAL